MPFHCRKKKRDMNQFSFESEVLERSNEVPVLVDFWSPTCGPCRVLGPILEKLADTADGKWELLKINTNEHQEVAIEQDIQSIPHVKLYSKGKVVSEFVGALPEPTLVKWLDEFIPNERKEKLNAIRQRLQEGDESALVDLSAFVEENPDMPLARLVLASEMVLDTPVEALEMVAPIQLGSLFYEAAENVRVIAEVLTFEGNGAEGAAGKIAGAREAINARDFDKAVGLMVESVEADKAFQKELPRRGTVALFRLLGPQHPITGKYRRKFEMALFR